MEKELDEYYRDIWAEEAETSDAIPEDETVSAELEAAFIALVESELEQSEDLTGVEDDTPEDAYTASAPIGFNTLREQIVETAVERTGQAARTEADFAVVIGELDRLDRNRQRRESYHEVLRGDVPLEYGKDRSGAIFPSWLSAPKYRLLCRGKFEGILHDCPYEMHNLTGNEFLSNAVRDLKPEHKELMYYLSLHLYSTTRLAQIRGQSDRNIRKVRDTYTRKLQKQLYQHLLEKRGAQASLTLREQGFIRLYEDAMKCQSKAGAKVKRENKYPRRKKATTGNADGG